MKNKNPDGVLTLRTPRKQVKGQPVVCGDKKPWRKLFIKALNKNPSVVMACEAANISRSVAYRDKGRSAVFRAQWETAQRESAERLESTAWKIGMRTSDKVVRRIRTDPKTGEQIVTEESWKVYPTVLATLLRSHLPERYREPAQVNVRNQVAVNATTKDAGEIKVEVNVERLPDAELFRIIAQAKDRGALSPDMLSFYTEAAPEVFATKELPAPDSNVEQQR
ncbi:MAG: hypothetical protein WCK90_00500 [archaeon]